MIFKEEVETYCVHTLYNMNNTSLIELTIGTGIGLLNCLPVQDKIPLLNTTIRLILAARHILIMSIGTPANIAVTYLIYRTEQYRQQSTRLIMILSSIDVFGACIINGASAIYMLSYEELSCPLLLIIHSFVNFSISLTFMMIIGVAIDRMLKVRHLNDYASVFTPFRFKVVLFCLSTVAVIQSILIFVGIYFFGYGYATIFSAPIHIISAVIMIICYLLSIKKLKEMNTITRRVSSSDRSIVKIATLHLTIFVACIMPTLIWQVVSNIFLSKILSKVIDVLILFVLYVLYSLHSTLNAFMFLKVNRDARRVIITFLQSTRRRFRFLANCFGSNPVIPAIDLAATAAVVPSRGNRISSLRNQPPPPIIEE